MRAHKRGKVAQDEITDTTARKVETQHVEAQTNEELFVIDTTGDTKAVIPHHLKQVVANLGTKNNNSKKSALSVLDQQRVDALIAKHGKEKLQAMVKEGEMRLKGNRSVVAKSQKKSFDLWGDEKEDDDKNNKTKKAVSLQKEDTTGNSSLSQKSGIKGDHVTKKARSVSKTPKDAVAVDVARGGQSYRPDPKHYEKAIQDAVSLEVRRNTAEEERRAPLAKGMSPETRALLVGDSSSSEEESDDDDGSDQEGGQEKDQMKANDEDQVLIRKRPEKLTRAERNRQKRIRQERAIEEKQKQNKKLLKSVAELPRYKKEIKKHQKELEEKKTKMEEEKKRKRGTPGKNYFQRLSEKDPLHAPTFPVALESEHKDASLRTVKPKGSLVTDRMASFVDRNLVCKRKMGDKKRIMQGKRRKLNVKGKGYEIAREMDHKLMG